MYSAFPNDDQYSVSTVWKAAFIMFFSDRKNSHFWGFISTQNSDDEKFGIDEYGLTVTGPGALNTEMRQARFISDFTH